APRAGFLPANRQGIPTSMRFPQFTLAERAGGRHSSTVGTLLDSDSSRPTLARSCPAIRADAPKPNQPGLVHDVVMSGKSCSRNRVFQNMPGLREISTSMGVLHAATGC